MTVHRLSARSVKVILSAEELQFFVTEPDAAPDSPQMMRLLAVMLTQAERVSGIADGLKADEEASKEDAAEAAAAEEAPADKAEAPAEA